MMDVSSDSRLGQRTGVLQDMPSTIHRRSDLGERTNLPLQLTSFVGRRAEIDEVKSLLSEARLVTLTGAGGIGKTRLALEVAGQLRDTYPDGVWLVELAGLTDPGLVAQAITSALGFVAQPGLPPMESLISVLGARDLLCVLDNCEHVVEAAAQLVDALLKHCPEVRILATSRDVLGVGGEVTWRVPSMQTPDVQRLHSLDELRGFETVQLVVERARLARPGFELDDDNARSVVRICQRLDGIPLALELVAARARGMSITAIDERIAHRFDLVTGGSRISMPRQRTLQATFDWSYDLLGEEEKRVFRRLSVFARGFTLDAAEAVCRVDGVGSRESSLESLTNLVDKSLVIAQEGAGDGGRYRLLEPIRQYAYDRLSEAHETDATRRSHAKFYLTLGGDTYRELRGPSQVKWMARVGEELDNFRACFGWSLRNDPAAALRLAVALERYWIQSSPAEGLEWLQGALELYSARDELRAHALYDAAFWAWYRGYLDEARQLGNECLALARELRSELYTGQALNALATVAGSENSKEKVAYSLSLFSQAEQHIRAAGDPEALGRLLNNYGSTLLDTGDLIGARAKIEEALALARSRSDVSHVAAFLESLADIECQSGYTANAERDWKRVLEFARQLGGQRLAGYALAGLARLALDDQPERSLRLLGAAQALFKLAGVVEGAQAIEDAQRGSRALLDDEVSNAVWRDGTNMSLLEAVRYALGESGSPDQSMSVNKPAVRSQEATRTFMFTDIVRSTELVGLIGDEAWHALIDWHHRTMREAFAAHRGDEVDSAGDGFFVAFLEARSAADCAIAIQRTLAEHRHSHGFAPFVRVGVHTTVARRSSEGYRGKGVHMAARIAAQADAGEILVSGSTAEQLKDRYVFSSPRRAALKGIAEEVLIASLNWR
jgi:predicted ATPase/class 3 adenylate cyclase